MKGIIFNLVEEVVSNTYGEETWDALLDAAGLDGSYTSLGSYADEDLFRLVAAASTALDAPPDQIVRMLGEGAIPLLIERYPFFFEGHDSTPPFLLTLNDIIHPQVLKLYPGSQVPDFDFLYDESEPNCITIGYQSDRQLCALAEGFITGAAKHYGEDVAITQPQCLTRGDEKCVIQCTFAPVTAPV
jgi:hypothetical protein